MLSDTGSTAPWSVLYRQSRISPLLVQRYKVLEYTMLSCGRIMGRMHDGDQRKWKSLTEHRGKGDMSSSLIGTNWVEEEFHVGWQGSASGYWPDSTRTGFLAIFYQYGKLFFLLRSLNNLWCGVIQWVYYLQARLLPDISP
jgi:hypothetical protein